MDKTPSRLFDEGEVKRFQKRLLSWYSQHARDLPWRQTNNPYHVWLSEIMLQQTRVDQAKPYFERFVASFPTPEHLASASQEDVLRLWEGLGYYSRARNLHKAARQVVDDFQGKLPEDHNELLKLPGIGSYTAAAVASIAFNKPHGVLDGNVIRVLTRLTCNGDDVTKGKTRKALQLLSDHLVSHKQPGDFNQGMMELGATICKPQKPNCAACPVQAFCCAFAAGNMESFPVAKKKAPVPHYDIAVAIIQNEKNQFLIQRRPEDGMLGGLWQFPGGRQETDESLEATCIREMKEELDISIEIEAPFYTLSHAYTHFKITLHAFLCSLHKDTLNTDKEGPLRWVAIDQLSAFPFSRSNRRLADQLVNRQTEPDLFHPPPA